MTKNDPSSDNYSVEVSGQVALGSVPFSISELIDEARQLVEKGTLDQHQPIYALCQYIPPREWANIECELERCGYLLRDHIGDLVPSKSELKLSFSPELYSQLVSIAGDNAESLSKFLEEALTFYLDNFDDNNTSDETIRKIHTYLDETEVSEIAPDDYKAWYHRGIVLSSVGRYEEAIASFDQALKIKPDYQKAWYQRGIALDAIDFYEEAAKSYDKAPNLKDNYNSVDKALRFKNKSIIVDFINEWEND